MCRLGTNFVIVQTISDLKHPLSVLFSFLSFRIFFSSSIANVGDFLNMSIYKPNYQFILCTSYFPVETGRKLNVHETFRRRPGRLLNVLYTFNLRPVSTG